MAKSKRHFKTQARLHVTIITRINKSAVYFAIRYNVKFCLCVLKPGLRALINMVNLVRIRIKFGCPKFQSSGKGRVTVYYFNVATGKVDFLRQTPGKQRLLHSLWLSGYQSTGNVIQWLSVRSPAGAKVFLTWNM